MIRLIVRRITYQLQFRRHTSEPAASSTSPCTTPPRASPYPSCSTIWSALRRGLGSEHFQSTTRLSPRTSLLQTTPNVVIWSAACASCAQPGLYSPVDVLIKDLDGTVKPMFSSSNRLAAAELPLLPTRDQPTQHSNTPSPAGGAACLAAIGCRQTASASCSTSTTLLSRRSTPTLCPFCVRRARRRASPGCTSWPCFSGRSSSTMPSRLLGSASGRARWSGSARSSRPSTRATLPSCPISPLPLCCASSSATPRPKVGRGGGRGGNGKRRQLIPPPSLPPTRPGVVHG